MYSDTQINALIGPATAATNREEERAESRI